MQTDSRGGDVTPHPLFPPTLGATPLPDGRCRFRVWAPRVKRLEVHVVAPEDRLLDMQPLDDGWFELTADVPAGANYLYRLDGDAERPDPASRFQPEGVHGASQVVAREFDWNDDHWRGRPLHEYVVYEMHVGTFSEGGTFDSAIEHLDELAELGVTAIELLPVAQFPGLRNWGYDGVQPFATQNSYGGPLGLKRFVDACHRRNIAVVLDVVYNHLGPEGNYLHGFAPYFTDRYRTPWGAALNFDGPASDHVRQYFIENALCWIGEFHIDSLRLDAVHAIYDASARPFLRELSDAVHMEAERLGRRAYLIAESNLNDSRMIEPAAAGGLGMDAQWTDDLHHGIHVLLTGERAGYYFDFMGFDDVVTAYRDGWVFSGQFSHYRGRRHGNSARHVPPMRHVVCSQNHDQIGNRMLGERLTEIVSFEQLKLAAGLVLLSPYVPMLFMGEEYGETAPFLFFTSHGDEGLIEAVRKGRKEEFATFKWQGEPPDPQSSETFARCKLNRNLMQSDRGAALRDFYKRLIGIRQTSPGILFASRDRMQVDANREQRTLIATYQSAGDTLAVVFHCGDEPAEISLNLTTGNWRRELNSAAAQWHGPCSNVLETVEVSADQSLTVAAHAVVVLRKC